MVATNALLVGITSLTPDSGATNLQSDVFLEKG